MTNDEMRSEMSAMNFKLTSFCDFRNEFCVISLQNVPLNVLFHDEWKYVFENVFLTPENSV